MIPIKLSMRNFMCYRGSIPALHFDGIHTASICGNNGNGKSALIDAITWALWGKARARRDDDLIYSGEQEMEVELEFAVGSQRYRVLRKHSRPKRRQASGTSSLDLFIASDNGFRPISGNTIRETQRKITTQVLHMDYDTFINSAFLRQGHADEFTTAEPAKRKQVLGNILGLSQYDEYEAEAKDLAKRLELEREQLESTIREIAEELAHKPAYQAELEKAQGELARIEALLQAQEERVSQLRQQRESLENKRLQLSQLEEHIAQSTAALEQWHRQLEQLGSRIREHQELIKRRSQIEEGYTLLLETRKLAEELDSKLRQIHALGTKKSELEKRVMEARQGLLTEHALTQSRIADLEAKAERIPQLRKEWQQAQQQLQHLATEEESLRQRQQTAQQLRAQLNSLENQKQQLQREINEISEKLHLLLSQEGARCPLCEAELGTDGLKRIEAKYTAERELKADSLKSNEATLASTKRELQAMEGEISQLEARLSRGRESAQRRAIIPST